MNTPIIVQRHCHYLEQTSTIDNKVWSVPRLIQLSQDLPVMRVPLCHMNTHATYKDMTLREIVKHAIAIEEADLSFPIILDEDGYVMDGRHRLMKAIMLGYEKIRAKRFLTNPEPDRILE